VNFNLQRHTGYFLIQVYVPCILIVVLSWVSFWIHREATSDRVGLGKFTKNHIVKQKIHVLTVRRQREIKINLFSANKKLLFCFDLGITTVLTLSTISLDSRKDLPKVRYATALDWFLLMNFFYCIATLLEFAGVHYFTKVRKSKKYNYKSVVILLESLHKEFRFVSNSFPPKKQLHFIQIKCSSGFWTSGFYALVTSKNYKKGMLWCALVDLSNFPIEFLNQFKF